MNHLAYHLEPLGDQAILVQLDSCEPLLTIQQTQTLQQRLTSVAQTHHWELVPGLASLTVIYDARHSWYADVAKQIQTALEQYSAPVTQINPRQHTIPICCDSEFAIDLAAIAQSCKLSSEHVVDLLQATDFTVGMLGFLPGFPYLLGLPVELHLPRRVSPRSIVPAGSVAIANDQCGIYPQPSPGGWHLIGRTPIRLFDADKSQPSLLQTGDRVRFELISRSEYDRWSTSR